MLRIFPHLFSFFGNPQFTESIFSSVQALDSDGRQTENEKRMQSTSSNKNQPSTKQQRQQLDSVSSGKSQYNEKSGNSAAADPRLEKSLPPASSKKSGTKGEVSHARIINLTFLIY